MGVLLAIVAMGRRRVVGLGERPPQTHPVPEGHQPDVEIPHEQEFELYHNALSLCSMKSRVCMAELDDPLREPPHRPHRDGRIREHPAATSWR